MMLSASHFLIAGIPGRGPPLLCQDVTLGASYCCILDRHYWRNIADSVNRSAQVVPLQQALYLSPGAQCLPASSLEAGCPALSLLQFEQCIEL